MNPITRLSVVAIATSLLAFTSSAPAQEAALPREDPEARALYEQFAANYRRIERHREIAHATMEFDTELQMFQIMSERKQRVWEFDYVFPNRLHLTMDNIEVVSDGERLWAGSNMLGKYVERPSPVRRDFANTVSELLGQWGITPPTLSLLFSTAGHETSSFWGGRVQLTSAEAEVVDGAACMRFDGVVVDLILSGRSTASAPCAVWFEVESGLMRSVWIDMTEPMRDYYKEMRDSDALAMLGIDEDMTAEEAFRSVSMSVRIERLPHEQLAENRFKTPDATGLERIDSLKDIDQQAIATRSIENQTAAADLVAADLIGENSPDLQGRAEDGRFVRLADHRGEVVLLVVTTPTTMNTKSWLRKGDDIQRAFEGMPVSAIGLIASRQLFTRGGESIDVSDLSIPVIVDDDLQLQAKFCVMMKPSLFVIDQQGVVQAVYESGEGADEEKLIDDVARLLEGERLFDEADVAARREELLAARAEREQKAPTLIIEAVDTDRLRGKRIKRWGMSNAAPYEAPVLVIDADNDGTPDLVTSDGSARLIIINGADNSTQMIELETVDEPGTHIAAFDTIQTESGAFWVVITSRRIGFTSQSTETIGVFRPDGSKVWRWTLVAENGEGILANQLWEKFSVGDLDGDEIDEIAIGITFLRNEYDSKSKDVLLALRANGSVIAAKPVNNGFSTVRIVPAVGGRQGWIATQDFTGVTRHELTR